MAKNSKEILPDSIQEFYKAAIQRGANYHFKKLMTGEYDSEDLIVEIHNIRRALNLLEREEIESTYTVEQITSKLEELRY